MSLLRHSILRHSILKALFSFSFGMVGGGLAFFVAWGHGEQGVVLVDRFCVGGCLGVGDGYDDHGDC